MIRGLVILGILLSACFAGRCQSLLNDVKELSSDKYQGRKTATQGNRMAAEYIVKRFKAIGLKSYNNSFKHSFSFRNQEKTIKGTNLIGYIQGKKKDVIVISAHYDHLGVINGKIYNGADDDASGIGGLLAIAEHFSRNKPEHTLVFVAFDAEEMGLQGAKAFVARPPVALGLIQLNINLDMISHNDKGELYVAGTYHYPDLKGYLFVTNTKIKLLRGHDNPQLISTDDWTNQGDHGAFHAKKIPFLYFGVEDHKDYHQPSDDFENINKEFYKNAVSSILEVVKNYDQGKTIQKVFRNKKIMQ
ncbi:M20/M25/M40 family metallo-hydrolase [Arcticibacter tournemirensis]